MNLEAELVFTQRWGKNGVWVLRVFLDNTHVTNYSLSRGFGTLDVFLERGFSNLMGVGIFYTSVRHNVFDILDALTKERYSHGYEFVPHLSRFPDWPLPGCLEHLRGPSREEIKQKRADTRAGAIEL